MSNEPPFTFGPPPVAAAGIDDDGDAIDDAVAHLPADTTPMPTPTPETDDWRRAYRELDAVIRSGDITRVRAMLQNGDYDRYSELGHSGSINEHEPLWRIVRNLPDNQFRLDAWDEFVRDGRVFRNAYGMLTILWMAITYAHPYYFLIISHIPAVTWRQMAMAVLWPGESRLGYGFPSGHFLILVQTVRRWGRHALTLDQIVALDELFFARVPPDRLPPIGFGIVEIPLDIDRLLNDEGEDMARSFNDAGRARVAAYHVGLRKRFDQARRRLCYRDIVAFVLGMANTTLDPLVLSRIAHFSLRCYDEALMQLDLNRVIDRIRTRIWAHAAGAEARQSRR